VTSKAQGDSPSAGTSGFGASVVVHGQLHRLALSQEGPVIITVRLLVGSRTETIFKAICGLSKQDVQMKRQTKNQKN